MPRHVFITFFAVLLSATAWADSIGVYSVSLNKKAIAEVNEFNTISLNLYADSLHVSDTIFISYWSCGPRPAGKYSVSVTDSASSTSVLAADMSSRQYKIPLASLLLWHATHPDAVYLVKLRGQRTQIFCRIELL